MIYPLFDPIICPFIQWICLREHLQESPIKFMGTSMVSDFPLNQSIDLSMIRMIILKEMIHRYLSIFTIYLYHLIPLELHIYRWFLTQEVIGAACTLATAYSVALWYFAPGTCGRAKAKHLPWAPALQGAAGGGGWVGYTRPGKHTKSYGKWVIDSWFTHEKLWWWL